MTPDRAVRCFALAVLAATGGLLLLFAAQLGAGLPTPAALAPLAAWEYQAIQVGTVIVLLLRALHSREERAAWLCFAAGCASYCAADVYWSAVLVHLRDVPYPSLADALYLFFYLPTLLGLGLLVRSRVGRFSASVWLDALVGGLSVAAVGAALVFPTVISTTGGATATVLTNLAYPLADMLLLAVVVGTVALLGWKPGRGVALLGAAFCVFVVGDSIYVYQTALGTYVENHLLDVTWPTAFVLLAVAAWQPARRRAVQLDGWAMLVAPLVLGAVSLGVVVYDHFTRVYTAALLLAAAALAAVLLRLALTFAEHLRVLHRTREESLTDELTSLRNRRALVGDLEAALATATAQAPVVLALYDLNGFKTYNDRFGHPAGDALLHRLGVALRAAIEPAGDVYRLGGDEFCLLAAARGGAADALVARGREALSARGEGFEIAPSYGSVTLPLEAADVAEAMREADRRLYADKNGGRASAGRQSSAVLLRALEARHVDLGHSLDRVASLAEAMARELGVGEVDAEEVRRAAALHDIGKVGIPEEILQKPGRLSEQEWEFVRRHTVIGQRILDAAPALVSVGRLVRSSHEHWNGSGYPDGLAGEDIPLGSRIVLVCDAYDAMTSERPYHAAVSGEAAVAELIRCSGTQFDPRAVDALCRVLARQQHAAAA